MPLRQGAGEALEPRSALRQGRLWEATGLQHLLREAEGDGLSKVSARGHCHHAGAPPPPRGPDSLVAHVPACCPGEALAPAVLAHGVPGPALRGVDLQDEAGSVEADCEGEKRGSLGPCQGRATRSRPLSPAPAALPRHPGPAPRTGTQEGAARLLSRKVSLTQEPEAVFRHSLPHVLTGALSTPAQRGGPCPPREETGRVRCAVTVTAAAGREALSRAAA